MSKEIVHIDLGTPPLYTVTMIDCFYCQVEQVHLGIPYDTPAAVQQWQSLIAVNYAARAAGIKR
jgi:nucleotidyltransferase/DNA polymerase involved in DNA repair